MSNVSCVEGSTSHFFVVSLELELSNLCKPKIAHHFVLRCNGLYMLGLLGWVLLADAAPIAVAQEDEPSDLQSKDLQKQVLLLSDPQYRVRDMAKFRLQENARRSIRVLEKALLTADHHSGRIMVDLLTQFATSDNLAASYEAKKLLEATAGRLSAVGQLARQSVEAISDLEEQRAVEVLLHNDAILGPRRFSLNSMKDRLDTEDALLINSSFVGDDECIKQIALIKSIETVCLEGPNIDRRHLAAVVKMKRLSKLKLKNVRLQAEDLELLTDLDKLDHLGLLYMEIDDRAVEVLKDLPVTTSMKIQGTKITREGFEKLQAELDGPRMQFGRGGFLGISSNGFGPQVGQVEPDSAAEKAGIRPNDYLQSIQGTTVTSFTEIRAELSKYRAGDAISIKVRRYSQVLDLTEELVLSVVLQEEN